MSGQKKNEPWRKWLRVHTAAELFPRMGKGELRALADNIKQYGLRQRVSIIEDKDGSPILIDGISRLDAIELNGEEIAAGNSAVFERVPANDVLARVVSLNIHRRHLSAEQRRHLIKELLKANPEKSDRTIAKSATVSDKTVGRERRKLESTAEVPQLDKTVGADGKPRKRKGKKIRPRRISKDKGESKRESEPSVSPAPKPAAPPPLPLVPSPKSALAEPNESDRREHLRAQKDELFERFHDFAEELDQDAAQRLRGLVNQADAIFEQVLAMWQPERREQEALPSAPMPNNEPPTDVKNDNEDDPFAMPASLQRPAPADLNAAGAPERKG
jgi:hypothetical protein